MLAELKAARGSRYRSVADWEMTIGIGIAPAGSDVRRVDHIGIDQLDVGTDTLVEICMPLLNVFAPEIKRLKEFRAVRYLAAEFARVLLFDRLRHALAVLNIGHVEVSHRSGSPFVAPHPTLRQPELRPTS